MRRICDAIGYHTRRILGFRPDTQRPDRRNPAINAGQSRESRAGRNRKAVNALHSVSDKDHQSTSTGRDAATARASSRLNGSMLFDPQCSSITATASPRLNHDPVAQKKTPPKRGVRSINYLLSIYAGYPADDLAYYARRR